MRFTGDKALIKLATPVQHVTPAKLYRQQDELHQAVWFIGSGGTGTELTGTQACSIKAMTNVRHGLATTM